MRKIAEFLCLISGLYGQIAIVCTAIWVKKFADQFFFVDQEIQVRLEFHCSFVKGWNFVEPFEQSSEQK